MPFDHQSRTNTSGANAATANTAVSAKSSLKGVGYGQGQAALSPRGQAVQMDQKAGPQKHYFDYARLLEDQKLEMTVGFGYSEKGNHYGMMKDVVWWLEHSGFKAAGADGEFQRFSKNHDFKLQTDKGLETVTAEVTIKIVTPKAGAKDAFLDGMANSDVVAYAGHARYGVGMDFDDKLSTDEQIVMGENSAGHKSGKYKKGYNQNMRNIVRGQENDLERMSKEGKFKKDKYQVMALSGCKTENYLDEMRGGLMAGKDSSNLDIIATNDTTKARASSEVIISFIEGILKQSDAEKIVKTMNRQQDGDRHFLDGIQDNKTTPY